MPVNPYDDRKASLRRTHGNGDLDIVGASYTRRKANLTEALKRISQKCRMFLSSAEIFEASSTNSIDPDQSDPVSHCLPLYLF